MRQRFQQQTTLGITPIREVKFPLHSRDELPPVLMALQHIFMTAELNEKVFALLEKKVVSNKKKTGRKGMDLWHILVLAVIRHTLDTNWDRLGHIANYDTLLRKMLGVHVEKFGIEEVEFAYQTIVDNVSLIDDELLGQINQLVVAHGHNLLKKKDEPISLQLKTDSYVLETNVHFPTDLNLLYDSLRKGLDMVNKLKERSDIKGWRKLKDICRTTKSLFRQASRQVFRSNGKNEQQKRQAVRDYLQQSRTLQQRFEEVIKMPPAADAATMLVCIAALKRYTDFAKKFSDQIERRLLKGEIIAPSEKLYSIFEDHTEWITKGKLNKKVELGHLLLLTTDQYNLIVDYKIMEGQRDAAQVVPLKQRIQQNYRDKKIISHSFDKGFYSKDNLSALEQQDYTRQVVLPKRGRCTKEDKERESSNTFKQLRKAHSAIESNINMLEHHGLNRCADKGVKGYRRNVGLSVLAYNLHIIGNMLKKQALQKEQKSKADKKRYQNKKQQGLSAAA